MGLRALRSFFSNAPGRAAAGRRVCVCVSARCPRPFYRGAPRVAVQRLPRPLFRPVGAGARPFGRAACWAARLCCGGAPVADFAAGLGSAVPGGSLCSLLGLCPFSLFASWSWSGLVSSASFLLSRSSPLAWLGWLRRRSVFQESAFLGYVPFGTWRVTVGAGLVRVSAGVTGCRAVCAGRGLPGACPGWSILFSLTRLRPVPARSAVDRLRFGLFAPAPVVWSCKLLSPPPCPAPSARACVGGPACFSLRGLWWFGFSCRLGCPV